MMSEKEITDDDNSANEEERNHVKIPKSSLHARFNVDDNVETNLSSDNAITSPLLNDHIVTFIDDQDLFPEEEPLWRQGHTEKRNQRGSIEQRKESGWSSKHSTVSHPHEEEKLLVELHELQQTKRRGYQWTVTARWVKYEERVEGVDKVWSQPRVAFLAFHSLTQLRLCFLRGVVLLDQNVDTYDELLELIVTTMANEYKIDDSRLDTLRDAISGNREKMSGPATSKSAVGFVAKKVSSFARQHTSMKLDVSNIPQRRSSATAVEIEKANDKVKPGDRKMVRMNTTAAIPPPSQRKLSRKMTKFFNTAAATETKEDAEFIKRLPTGVQGAQVLCGAVKDIAHVRFAMVRLTQAKGFPEFRNANVPLRFLFVLLGPPSSDLDYHEAGRSLATLMANPNFQIAAMKAESRKDIIDAIDTFLDEGIVLPPVDIDKGVMNNVDEIKKALRRRSKGQTKQEPALMDSGKDNQVAGLEKEGEREKKAEHDEENPLQRTGRLFGGLVRDVRKRAPYYWSDIKDAWNLQCLTSVCFMFFAAMAPAITFGGLLENKTDGMMGTIEVLVAQSLCGIVWALFSAQPLLIMAATGPFLIFEGSLFDFCKEQDIDFMAFRVWAGVWVFVAAFITVMLEGSFLIRYFTRFTEDIFATLVALIFIVESLKFIYKSFIYHPVTKMTYYCGSYIKHGLLDIAVNDSTPIQNIFNTSQLLTLNTSRDEVPQYLVVPEVDAGHHGDLKGQPDTALLSAVLVIGTFYLSYQLRQLRTTIFLGRPLRRLISDFGVPIAIFIVVLIDFTLFTQPYVQHLVMSDTFAPTSPSKRGWFIHPFGDEKRPFPIWAYFAAIVPALLVYILLFVECELTQLLLLRPERKLQKGGGFHWDLLLLGGLTLLCSFMGLPWMCAAVLQSLAHSSSLTIMKNRAPGQAPQVHKVVEQRVTTMVISLLTGACAFLGFVLKEIPIAVLFGVFLFLGVMTLAGVEMTNRLVLMFVPQKYFPEKYKQDVSMWRMHLYTIIQLVCLALMWTCKSIQQTSLVFPFMLMIIALFRIFGLPKIFSEVELEALDGEEELEEDEDGEIDMFNIAHMGV